MLHLHPTAQRQLKDALLLLATNGDQIFINTHSSVLVTDEHPTQRIFSVEKKHSETEILLATERDKPQLVFELLGGSPADLLFPNNFLIVEGRTEFEFLTRVIRRFYAGNPRLQIIFTSGDSVRLQRTVDAINVAFTPLNQTPIYRSCLVIFCDQPNAAQRDEFERFKQRYPHLEANRQLFLLAEGSIEEAYPIPWKKTPEEVRRMSLRDKTDLGKEVGDNIGQADFERALPSLFSALQRAWERAHR